MNKLTLLKVLGLGLTIGGTIVTSIVTGKENKETLAKLVNDSSKSV